MYNYQNTSIVIQGNLNFYSIMYVEAYQEHFDNVILSTWLDEDTSPFNCKCVKSNKVEPGPGNCNLQITSSLNGLKEVKTEFAIKVRSDILIEDFDKWLQFFSEHQKDNRIFVLGLSDKWHYSPRDQIFAGRTEDLEILFDIPHLDGEYTATPSINNMYPELWLGLHWFANFSDETKLFLANPQKYILSNAPERNRAMLEWHKIKHDHLLPVPRNLKYKWPKRFGNGYYNYDETARDYGEYWYENTKELNYAI
jgi:hypothetical protein